MSEATTERLEAIQAELAEILEARLRDLNQMLRGTESTTRRIVSAELELERHKARGQLLEDEIGDLESQVESARASTSGIRERHESLQQQRDEAAQEAERIQGDVRKADEDLRSTREQVTRLEAEAETLRSENAALKAKLKTLEENIARMRRLKEELMSSISGLTQQMTGLAGGSD